MRPTALCLLLLCVACAYDPLGIDVDDQPDAAGRADAGLDTTDAGEEGPVVASRVEPGCPADEGWCERTPHFTREGDDEPRPPGFLTAVTASGDGVWAGGQHFQLLRWTGETWVQEHLSAGEVNALWVDASGFGWAVGSVPGVVRKRKIMLRHPDGDWTPLELPTALAEGDLTGVWGVVGEDGVRFRATTGLNVLLEGDETGAIDTVALPEAGRAILPLEEGSLDALVGGPKGVWRIDAEGAIESESSTVEVHSFFVSEGGIGAEGGGHVWQRGALGLWTQDVAPSRPPLVACGGTGERLMLTGGEGIARREALSWREETVTAPAQTSLSACLSLPDGSGWAVGYVVTGGLPGLVLRLEAP